MAKKGQRTGVTFNCEWCGKEVYQNTYHYNHHKHHFCSNDCQMKMKHKMTYEFRKCEICGAEYECLKKSTKRFCCEACQHEWQKGNVGIKNVRFKSILTKCTWCGKEIYVKPYKIKSQTNTFCSKECRQEWYAKYWSQREEWKEQNRDSMLQRLQSGAMVNVNTAPQIITNEILDHLGIPYINEQMFIYYAVDNYLYEHNLIIEVMGDYWHLNPIRFANKEPTDVQKKRVPKDKAKHKYLVNYYGIECLYLWESDLYHNKYLCELLIEQYYYNDGILPNYNSFNYHLDNGVLLLNDDIIYPDFLIEETKEAG